MIQRVARYGVVGLAVGLLLASGGCSSPSGSTTQVRMQTLCSARLDDCRDIELTCDRLKDHPNGDAQREYDLLRIVVRPREHLSFEETVKSVALNPGVPRGQFKFDDVEVRQDASGQRIWFVQRGTSRIIATVDLANRVTTGPDDKPPAWATPTGGELLKSTAK